MKPFFKASHDSSPLNSACKIKGMRRFICDNYLVIYLNSENDTFERRQPEVQLSTFRVTYSFKDSLSYMFKCSPSF